MNPRLRRSEGHRTPLLSLVLPLLLASPGAAQVSVANPIPPGSDTLLLPEVRMRDVLILPQPEAGVYYAISSAGRTVRAFASRDLVHWSGPHTIFRTPPDLWGDVEIRGIWAPEMHEYEGKYYLFLTFDTNSLFPEQWRDWRPRVKRGSQVLVGDSPLGPFTAFEPHSTLPVDMMTLDGTLWVEDGVPYMVFAHEWVQIKDGTVEMIRLTDDLSRTVGEPVRLFHGSDGPWARRQEPEGCFVTDAPWLYRTRTGKLLMLWSSFGDGGYMVGIAESGSGTLRGPWVQHEEALFAEGGGHPMLFRRFDGQLMMVLHQPNDGGRERARLFEIEDTGKSLRIVRPFPG
jgi:arabinan endo-1,5-alpha-L-arabinosidase